MMNTVEELGAGLYRLPTMGVLINSYAIVDPDGSVTLIDCGTKQASKAIVRGLCQINKSLADVQRIVLTHAHHDHAGSAEFVRNGAGLDGVAAHEQDAEFIRHGASASGDATALGYRLFARNGLAGFAPVSVSHELRDGDTVPVAGGLQVIHTPGHTPGHISLLHHASQTLITGDAIFNLKLRMTWPIAFACTSAAMNKVSAAKLADAEYATAAFTHGPVIRDQARERVREFVRQRLKSERG